MQLCMGVTSSKAGSIPIPLFAVNLAFHPVNTVKALAQFACVRRTAMASSLHNETGSAGGGVMVSTTARRLIMLAAITCWVAALSARAQAAADFPNKPVRFISAAVAGAGSDTTARAIAHRLTQMWGQGVIVDNRPGASGLIALDVLAKALPDGHTLALISANVPLNTAINPTWPYDVVKDMKPLSQVTSLF
jgi:hypothetical protein